MYFDFTLLLNTVILNDLIFIEIKKQNKDILVKLFPNKYYFFGVFILRHELSWSVYMINSN